MSTRSTSPTSSPGEGRFRVNISRQRTLLQHRAARDPAPDQDLRGAEPARRCCATSPQVQRGLVLVTGATGMGKSTTLATMLQEVNRARKSKIVTIEDPIEFVFTHDAQHHHAARDRDRHRRASPTALRAALRQDPDVIMVGEMRDLETVDTSLKAAETGHLVFSSIHTNDVVVDASTGWSRSSRPRSTCRCARAWRRT